MTDRLPLCPTLYQATREGILTNGIVPFSPFKQRFTVLQATAYALQCTARFEITSLVGKRLAPAVFVEKEICKAVMVKPRKARED